MAYSKDTQKQFAIDAIKKAIKEINEYLTEYGPDKELELTKNYLFNKIWKKKK